MGEDEHTTAAGIPLPAAAGPGDVAPGLEARVGRNWSLVASAHQMGTCRMGHDKQSAVCDERGEVAPDVPPAHPGGRR